MSFEKKPVIASNAPAPPPFLSQAILMGDFLFCSGQVGCHPETGALIEGSIGERTVSLSFEIMFCICWMLKNRALETNSFQPPCRFGSGWD